MTNRKPRGFWTEENIAKEIQKYDSIGEFFEKSVGAYNAAIRIGVFEKYTGHLTRERQRNNYWTADRCREEVKNYKTFDDLRINNYSLLSAIYRLNLEKEIINNLPRKSGRKPRGYWNRERCYAAAKNYNHRADFQYGPDTSAYDAAKKNGWLEEICAHMKPIGHEYRRAIYFLISRKKN